jgi:radical SAM superfamily enzyme YgiQ (UPF0313 family)
MKILLIWPRSRNEVLGWGDLGAIAEPLALEYLAAGAKQDGHEVRILDMRLHQTDLNRTLLEFRPDIVGVTAFSMHVITALTICRHVKKVLPNTWTIIGGHHATLLPVDFFEPQIDFVVSGEGVSPFRALLRALENKTSVTEIPRLWSRVNGEFVMGAETDAFDIDELPMPDRSVTAMVKDRDSYFIDWMKPIALLRTTVGCPYRCSFCSLWRIMDGKYHMREIERVVEEVGTIPEPCPGRASERGRSLTQAHHAVERRRRLFRV